MNNSFGWLNFWIKKSAGILHIERRGERDCIDGHMGSSDLTCGYYLLPEWPAIDEIRHSLSFAIKPKEEQNHSTIFVSKTRVIATKINIVVNYSKRLNKSSILMRKEKNWNQTKAHSVLTINPKLRKIGLYLNESSKELYVFFSINSVIKYCSATDVRKFDRMMIN